MDHLEALSSKASERYLLGEMSEPERFAFEDHYFQCGECANEVRAGSALARAIQAVGREDVAARPRVKEAAPERGGTRWWGWLSPAALSSAAVAAMLACVVGYQATVTIPSLRTSRAVSPIVLRAAARGDEQTIDVKGAAPYAILSLDVNAAEPGAPLRYEISPAGGAVQVKGTATAPLPGSPLLIVVARSDLERAGAWTLVLRTPEGIEIGHYPFQLKNK